MNFFSVNKILTLVVVLMCVKFKLSVGNFIKRQQQPGPLTPTLTLDVGGTPHVTNMPTQVHQDKPLDYYFPLEAQMFTFSCVIKHPSMKPRMSITKEQVSSNGTRSEPIEFFDKEYNQNPNLKDKDRISIEFEELENPKAIKASLVIKSLKLSDSGFYKCSYSSLVKQINVIVFKQPHNKDITFPLSKLDRVQLNQPLSVNCRVNEIYPKPVVSFIDSSGSVVESDKVTVKDLSNKTSDDYYLYSSMNTYNFSPKYSDNNQNLTCSVFSYGATNLTLQKSVLLKVEGIEFITESCLATHSADLGEQDFKITCLFFSNPRVEPEWETIKPKPVAAAAPENTEGIPAAGNEQGDTEATQENTSVDEIEKISYNEDDSSNYVASIEDEGAPHSGLYKAVLRVKVVSSNDFKTYTIKLDNKKRQIEQVVKLEKKLTLKEQMIATIPSSAGSEFRINRFHSKIIFSLLFQTIIFVFMFNR